MQITCVDERMSSLQDQAMLTRQQMTATKRPETLAKHHKRDVISFHHLIPKMPGLILAPLGPGHIIGASRWTIVV